EEPDVVATAITRQDRNDGLVAIRGPEVPNMPSCWSQYGKFRSDRSRAPLICGNHVYRHPPDDRPSDPSLPPDDGICKSEPCLECRHAPTAGNIGTPRAGSPEIAFIKRHLSYGSCWN